MKIINRVVGILSIGVMLFATTVLADISRVRVVNDTNSVIYVHPGAYAPSQRIEPGKWKIFPYPFTTTPPGTNQVIKSSLVAASSGGRWMTTPNGYTYLSKPNLVLCLDYKSPEHSQKTGNRVWTIKSDQGFDKGCQIKGYKQPWYKDTAPTPNGTN